MRRPDGYTQKSAQVNLRAVLANLRQLFAPFDLLAVTHRTIGVKVNPINLWCDVIAFQEAWQNRSALEPQAWQAFPPQAGFLCSLPTIDSAPFERWRSDRQVTYGQQREELQYELRQHRCPVSTMAPTSNRFCLNGSTTCALYRSALPPRRIVAYSTKVESGATQATNPTSSTNVAWLDQRLNGFNPSVPLR